MSLKRKLTTAFTLIELLMVISIVSLLSTVVFSFTTETRAKARDSVRLSDMKQIGTAMQMYYQDEGKIPSSFNDLVPNYLPSIPLDPKTKQPYTFATTTNTAIVYANYENQFLSGTTTKSVGVAVGDTDLETLCAPEHTGYPNCTGGSPNDQIVFIDPGITYGGGGGGGSIQLPTVNLSVSSSTISEGSTVNLSWTATNSTSCTASGDWSGSKSTSSDSENVGPLSIGNYSYKITCVGSNNDSASSTGSVIVIAETGGSGTAEDPYKITSWTDLNNMRNNLSAYYKLTKNLSSADSDYAGIGDNWVPVGDCGADTYCGEIFIWGDYSADDIPFSGSFNGNNKTISDLIVYVYSGSSDNSGGLFTITSGNISNIGLVNNSITVEEGLTGGLVGYQNGGAISNSYSIGNVGSPLTGSYSGGLVGYQNGGTISNSYSGGSVNESLSPSWVGEGVGGLVGYSSSGVISNSYSTSLVKATYRAGGLVGSLEGGTISNSYSTGNVYGAQFAGGLVGLSEGTISNSYSTSNVYGESWGNSFGGLVGYQQSGTISNSYSTGKATGGLEFNTPAKGFLGGRYYGTVSNCYWDIETSEQETSVDGIGKTTAEMKTPSTFSAWSSDICDIVNGFYPTLK